MLLSQILLTSPSKPWSRKPIISSLAFSPPRAGVTSVSMLVIIMCMLGALAFRRTLYLPPEIERMAEAEQTEALESDVREGMIAEYLEKLLPEDWDRMDLSERRGFLRGDPFTGGSRTGTVRRTVVSAVEIWAECFGKEPTAIRRSDTYDIFGMLMKIGGWEKYSGNKNSLLRRPPYGPQRCYQRIARERPASAQAEQRPVRA